VDYVRAGRTAEAIALAQQTLRSQQLIRGPDHPDTLSALSDLAAAYGAAGRAAEAIALDLKALSLQKSKLGPDHPDTLLARMHLAQQHVRAGHTAEEPFGPTGEGAPHSSESRNKIHARIALPRND
jgi:hypothetical protein